MNRSFAEASARERIAHLLDAGSFREILGPAERVMSPHLAQLDTPAAFDDGVAIGRGLLQGQPVLVAAQEGGFMGGGVGEVHGAKLVGLFKLALSDRPQAVLVLAESGGVRLHEANAGLIGISEVMRALLDVRHAGIPVLMLIGGAKGCFGGMGLVARCADHVVMSDLARLAMSGPEVIESSHGVEEFDSKDLALVWRTTGGKHRFLTGDCDVLVEDDIGAFRAAAGAALGRTRPVTLESLADEHALLAGRLAHFGECHDAREIWSRLGLANAAQVTELDTAALRALKSTLVPSPSPASAGETNLHTPSPTSAGGAASWPLLLDRLFAGQHSVHHEGELLRGTAQIQGRTLAIVGTTDHAAIGVELALAQARVVLDTVRNHPGRPLLLLVDTQGQRLRHRDELLGINRYMAHLGCCIELARRSGHRVIGLVYDQALSGGFITSGLIADACYALPEAQIRVMRLPAMARVTKIDEKRLEALSLSNPVFAPGVQNYVAMGGVRALWHGDLQGDLQAELLMALDHTPIIDERARDGAARGGRQLAAQVIARVAAA